MDRGFSRKYALQPFALDRDVQFARPNWSDRLMWFVSRIAPRVRPLPLKIGPYLLERPTESTKYDPAWKTELFGKSNTLHVYGYRQNEEYFVDYAAEIRALLSVQFEPSKELAAFADELRKSGAVSVSLRRQQEPGNRVTPLDARYYHTAVELIRQRVDNPVFCCFGDSLEGSEALMPTNITRLVPPSVPDTPADLRDFWLMQQCHRFILANSTFGWWAAWLAQKEDSVVVCPKTDGFKYKIAPARTWLVV
jgi:hypothetical protein